MGQEGQTLGLNVRRHERAEARFRVEFVVAEHHRGQVRFSRLSSASEPFIISGHSTDLSSGGCGVVTRQFLPRKCEGILRLFHPNPEETASDGSPLHGVAFEHLTRVRRVTMHSHLPEYAIGLSLVDPAPDIPERVAALMRSLLDLHPGEA